MNQEFCFTGQIHFFSNIPRLDDNEPLKRCVGNAVGTRPSIMLAHAQDAMINSMLLHIVLIPTVVEGNDVSFYVPVIIVNIAH